MNPTRALSIRGLTKTYGNGVQALRGIDLEVREGDFFALLGPNGAGKTTAIGITTSLVTKTAGSVKVFGYDIDRELSRAKTCIGLVPQEINFNMFEKVFTVVVNQAGFYGIPRRLAIERAERYLRQLQLWDKRNQIARSLSGGMKRRLMIARALVHEPRLLILDEPTAGVDIEIRRSMWDFLRDINQRGTTIILTTHYLEEAENLCRTIAIIDNGRIIENDTMAGVIRKLNQETFVLNFRNPLEGPPPLPGYVARMTDGQTLEVEVSKEQGLNDIFSRLSAGGIEVVSMRNKVNRLEELFMRLVENKAAPAPRRAEMAAAGEAVQPALPSLGRIHRIGFETVVRREFGRIIRIWGQTLVPPAVTATLYFLIFGSLIGKRIGPMGGYDYMQYIAPGLIMMAVISNSYGNVVSSFFGAKFGKHIEELLVAPLPNWLIVLGYVSGGVMRGLMVGVVVTGVALFFTHIPVHNPLMVASSVLLTSIVFSLGGFFNAIFAKNFDQISWFPTFVLTPLIYLGGVFYSVSLLPGWAETLSYANPILYMVNTFRYGFLGASDVDLGYAFVIMIGFAAVMFTIVVTLMNRGTGIRE